jgi:hypothetical protein
MVNFVSAPVFWVFFSEVIGPVMPTRIFSTSPNLVVIRPGIMHQHAEFTYLVDVLAVDFEIVDGLADG